MVLLLGYNGGFLFVKEEGPSRGRKGIPADVVVFAVGFRSHGSDLYEELLNSIYPVSVINSGLAPANFYQTTKGGYYAASVI